ncbi:MAG: hypothetical protein U9O82_02080 [Thermodesulfobacteriota bacterium]|nr:hypothetical protein [Thermodesulfobacteriota bacterium]
MRLFFKANILKELENVPDVIDDLHVFHLVVKRDFIEKFKARIQQEGSSIAKSSHSTPSTLGKLMADIKG